MGGTCVPNPDSREPPIRVAWNAESRRSAESRSATGRLSECVNASRLGGGAARMCADLPRGRLSPGSVGPEEGDDTGPIRVRTRDGPE
jgi:hypothetical protein